MVKAKAGESDHAGSVPSADADFEVTLAASLHLFVPQFSYL